MGFPGGSVGKESTCDAGDAGLIPGLGRSPGGGHGYPLQYSYLENPHGQWIHVLHHGRLPFMGPQRVDMNRATKHTHYNNEREKQEYLAKNHSETQEIIEDCE